jgi:hypothetical protein
MIIYTDIFSGLELCSDAYKMEEIHDVIYKITSKLTVIDESGDFKVYDGDAFGGKDEDAEEGGPVSLDDQKVRVNEIIHKFHLQPTSFETLKDYQVGLKGYLKRVTEHLTKVNPDRVKPFQAGVSKFIKEFFAKENGKFSEIEFYTGENYDSEAMIVICRFDDKDIPQIYLFKDGLKAEKI